MKAQNRDKLTRCSYGIATPTPCGRGEKSEADQKPLCQLNLQYVCAYKSLTWTAHQRIRRISHMARCFRSHESKNSLDFNGRSEAEAERTLVRTAVARHLVQQSAAVLVQTAAALVQRVLLAKAVM